MLAKLKIFTYFILLTNSLAAEVSSPTKEAFDSTQQKVVKTERIKDVWTLMQWLTATHQHQ